MSDIFKVIFPRPIPKARLSDVQGPGNDNPKVLRDFERVCAETGILDQAKRQRENQ